MFTYISLSLYIYIYIYIYVVRERMFSLFYIYIYILYSIFYIYIFDDDVVDNVENVDDDDGNVDTVDNVNNDYKVSNRTVGPSFCCHNKSTLYPTFPTPTVKPRQIGNTRLQGLTSEKVYSSRTATSTSNK